MKWDIKANKGLLTTGLVGAVVLTSAFQAIELPNVSQAVPVDQFVNFESAHVHPIDMTPDGNLLLAVNTANNSLEVFSAVNGVLGHVSSIPVGLDPVSVRARNNSEAWVVDQVSDEISIVDLTQNIVVRSLTTEDEPADVVFAGGTPATKAFVSCAGRESVLVFDLSNLDGTPTEVLLKGEQPRALAVSNDKMTVYCAFFESGNATTVLNGNDFFNFQHGTNRFGVCSPQGGCTVIPNDVTNPGGPLGGLLDANAGIVPNSGTGFSPPFNTNLPPTPETKSMIVRKNAIGQWLDDNSHDWTDMVSGNVAGKARIQGWDMPDRDVAVIDAASPSTAGVTYQTRLGNILMAMAVDPSSGQVSVVGTDATNEIRFEPNLNGRFLRVNISQFGSVGGANVITDLNPHLDYLTPAVAPALRMQSIGDPRGVAYKPDGSLMYVTGMGSNNVIRLNPNGSRNQPDPIPVGEGPTGIVLDAAGNMAYVLNRFEGSISTLDLSTNEEVARTSFFDPTPEVIKAGRRHLYNTHEGSGTGHIACGSCHVDARWDRLGWDLGDPSGEMENVDGKSFHPLKGVKTTQFLIDIIDRGRGNLHWRGDKAEFADFATAFQNLQGRVDPKPLNEMEEFADFLSNIWYVPNPYRVFKPESQSSVSRMNTPPKVRGIGTTFQSIPPAVNLFISVNINCAHCHNAQTGRGELAGNGNVAGTGAGQLVDFGPNRNMAADLRSTYRKNGFFYNTTECNVGFGMMSEGVMETWFNEGGVGNYLGDYEPELLSWSGGIHPGNCAQCFNTTNFPLATTEVHDALPALGLRQTLNGAIGSISALNTMLDLAETRPNEYGMIVKGVYGGERRGFYYLGGNMYQSDMPGETVTHSVLVSAAQSGSQPMSWTLVHPSTKIRMGVDRDADGVLDKEDSELFVNARVILEGPYQAGIMRTDLLEQDFLPKVDPYGLGDTASTAVMERTGPTAPVDWVVLEVRESGNSGNVLASRAVLLAANGMVMTPSGESTVAFPSLAEDSYHISIWHRNHLGAMTMAAIAFSGRDVLVDFTDPAMATYGTDARKNINGTMALWAGDVSGDGVLRYTNANNDRDPILAIIGGVVPTQTAVGYLPEDVDLDGVVKYTGANNDRDVILQNIGGTVPTNVRVEQLP